MNRNPGIVVVMVVALAFAALLLSCQNKPFGFFGLPVESLPQRADDPIPICDEEVGILMFCVNLYCLNGEKWLKTAEEAENALDFNWRAFSPQGHALRRITAPCGYRPITLYFDTDACDQHDAFFQVDQDEFFRKHPPAVKPDDVEWHKDPEVLKEELKLKDYTKP